MPRFAPALVALIALLGLAPAASAQASDELRRVVLKNGTIYVGTVADETADPLIVVTRDGVTRQFSRDQIDFVAPLINGRFYRTDPVKTRLLLAPTARTQGAGEFRGDLAGYLPSVTYGINDRVDFLGSGFFLVGDGVTVTPLLGLKGQVYRGERVQVALGASAIFALGDGTGFGAVPYGVATIGSETGSVSFGAAGAVGGAFDSGLDAAEGVVYALGGDKQINNGVKLFVESYVGVALDGGGEVGLLILPGVRFFGNNVALDVIGFFATDFEGKPVGFAPIPARLSYRF